jgi:hypothetical protein
MTSGLQRTRSGPLNCCFFTTEARIPYVRSTSEYPFRTQRKSLAGSINVRQSEGESDRGISPSPVALADFSSVLCVPLW